jgi:UDP-glucose 4-epimerase
MSTSSSLVNKIALVTGGAGFIGSHLVKRLLNLKNQVIVLDNLSSGTIENLPPRSKGLSFVKGDIRDLQLVKKLVKKSKVVFHLAEFIPNTEQSGPGHIVKLSTEKPLLDFDICVRGTLNVLEAARQTDTKIIFTSSAAVYGEPLENPVKETTLANPISPYGASKLAAEIYCKLFDEIYNVPVVTVRLFNVYGPRQRKYVIHDILFKLEKNPNNLSMLGSGDQQRDFVYVDDVVDGLIFLSGKEEYYSQIFNFGTGVGTSIKKIVKCTTNLLGVEPTVTWTQSSWKGDINSLVADPTKLRGIGFKTKHSLVEGIKKLIHWYHVKNSAICIMRSQMITDFQKERS